MVLGGFRSFHVLVTTVDKSQKNLNNVQVDCQTYKHTNNLALSILPGG